jgi:hypothetical protein
MVRCKGCLGPAIRFGNLSRHLKKEHKDYYKANKDQRRKWFVAKKDQVKPDDPDCEPRTVEIGSDDEEEFKPISAKKQRTTPQKSVDFAVEFENAFK